MKSAKEDMEKWDALLDEYEKSLGLPKYIPNNLPEDELQNYISMQRNEIEK